MTTPISLNAELNGEYNGEDLNFMNFGATEALKTHPLCVICKERLNINRSRRGKNRPWKTGRAHQRCIKRLQQKTLIK